MGKRGGQFSFYQKRDNEADVHLSPVSKHGLDPPGAGDSKPLFQIEVNLPTCFIGSSLQFFPKRIARTISTVHYLTCKFHQGFLPVTSMKQKVIAILD